VRRRAVVPAFHKQYYEAMVKMFAACTDQTVNKLDALLQASGGRCAEGTTGRVDARTQALAASGRGEAG
jgi:hypothetical protein